MFKRAFLGLLLVSGLWLSGLAGSARPSAHADAVVSPTAWHTFLGGSLSVDAAVAVAVDGAGNVYVLGCSDAAWGAPINPYAGGNDVWVARLDSNGLLQWHTFLGGSRNDWAGAIALDNAGNVYVAGSSDVSWGSPLNPHAGRYDVFVAQLDSNGARQWHTFLGGSDDDWGYALVGPAGGTGGVYVAGFSYAAWGSPINPYAGGWSDILVAKLSDGGALQWHTFLGSSSDGEGAEALAVDNAGNLYIAGWGHAAWGNPVAPYVEGVDALAARLSGDGVLEWHTFLGGVGYDTARSIAIDGAGNAYVAGWSAAAWGNPVNPYAGNDDAFAARLSSDGVRQWHTFLGSEAQDQARGVALSASGDGNVYVTGYSKATWDGPLNPHAGSIDAFVSCLTGNGVRQWLTFLGSSEGDWAHTIVLGEAGPAFVAGEGGATWGSPVNPYAGNGDAFVARLASVEFNVYLPLAARD